MPQYVITSPDGRKFKITAPEGATKEEALQFAKSQFEGKAESTIPDKIGARQHLEETKAEKFDPTVGTGEYLKNKFKRGIVEGVINLPGYAVDLAQLPARGLGALGVPGFEKAYNEEDWMSASKMTREFGNELLGVDQNMKPPSNLARYGGGVAEFAGAGVVPSGLVVGTARKVVPAVATETAATVGGGLGSVAGGDTAEALGLPRFAGELVGGITGATGASSLPGAISKGKGAIQGQRAAQANKAAKEIQGVVAAEKADGKIEESFKVADDIQKETGLPFTPTLAGRTESDIIADLEQEVLGRNIQSAERALANQDRNLVALEKFKDASFPKNDVSIERAASSKILNVSNKIDEAANKLAAMSDDLANRMRGRPQQAVGEELDSLRANIKAGRKASLSQEIDDIYKSAANVKDDMSDIVGTVKKIAGDDVNAYQRMPPVFGQIFDKYIKKAEVDKSPIVDAKGKQIRPDSVKSPTASFEEIHSLYKETNRQLAAAGRTVDGAQQAHYLKQLKGALERKLAKFEGEEYGDLGKRFKMFNRRYAETYAKPFKEGVGGRMSASGKYGKILNKEFVVKKFFTPSGLDDFARIYGDDPSAMALLKNGILDLFAKSVGITKSGQLDPKLAANFVKTHAEALNKLPALKKELNDASSAMEAIIQRNAKLLDAKNKIESGLLAKVANTNDLDGLVAKVLTDRKALIQLLSVSHTARPAVINKIVQMIPSVANKNSMSVFEFISKNESTLKVLMDRYGKDHFSNIKTIAKAMDIMASSKPPLHPALTQFNTDPIQAWTGTTGPSLLSQYRATQITRQSSPTHMASSVLMRFWMKLKGEDAKKMQEYLLTSPDAARDFNAALKAEGGQLQNRLRAHAVAAGVRSALAADDDPG